MVILFDLGGVLVDFRGFDEMRRLLGGAPSRDEIRARWGASPSLLRYEAGLTDDDTFAAAFVAEWGLSLSPADFMAAFSTWADRLFPAALPLLAGLAGRHRLAILSNTNALHWGHLERTHRLAAHMEAVFLSHQLGLCKPDPAIYAHVIAALGVPPAEILFLDDAPANVAAARALGIDAVQVQGAAEAGALLAARGLC